MMTTVGTAADDISGYRMFIGGEWADATSGQCMESQDPFRGRAWATVPEAGYEDVDRAVRAARSAFDTGPWPRMPARERARALQRVADLVRTHGERLATLETRDNGKLIRETRGQLRVVPEWFEYFAGWADKVAGDLLQTDKPNFLVYTLREPIGVVAAITVWNSPLLVFAMKVAPALAAGCTVVVKPSEQAPVTSLELARLFEEADLPTGVVNVVTGGREVGAALTSHEGVDRVSFTGSESSGVAVARSAAGHLAEVSLELGGKSPNLVFADADLPSAVNGAVAGVFAAAGQTCIAGSRLLIEASIFDEFVGRLVERANTLRLGDPLDIETELGPLAFREQHEKVAAMVGRAREDGACVLAGGGPPADPDLADGLFFTPTVVGSLDSDSYLAQEEVFGPVVCVLPFEGEDEAVRLANDTRYGLGAGVWTRDVARAHRVASRLRAGTVWVNSYRTVSYSVPFGGFKMSGYGRENGREAIDSFLRTKAVWVELSGQTRDPFTLG